MKAWLLTPAVPIRVLSSSLVESHPDMPVRSVDCIDSRTD